MLKRTMHKVILVDIERNNFSALFSLTPALLLSTSHTVQPPFNKIKNKEINESESDPSFVREQIWRSIELQLKRLVSST